MKSCVRVPEKHSCQLSFYELKPVHRPAASREPREVHPTELRVSCTTTLRSRNVHLRVRMPTTRHAPGGETFRGNESKREDKQLVLRPVPFWGHHPPFQSRLEEHPAFEKPTYPARGGCNKPVTSCWVLVGR